MSDSFSSGAPTSPSLLIVLRDAFDRLPDPRVERTRLHRLSDILLLSLAGVCCGAEGFEDIQEWADEQEEEELRRDLGVRLDNGIPHHDTFRRVLCRLSPATFEESLNVVRHRLPARVQDASLPHMSHIAIDGKEVRGSHDAALKNEAILLLSAFATDVNLVIGQKKVDAKTNEIPAAQEILAQIDIEGATVTADALHCQRETARLIRERKADYLLAVKDNQRSLYQALIGLFETNRQEKCLPLPMTYAQTLEKDHGRIEKREGWLIQVKDWLPETDSLWKQWTDLNSVLCLACERRWTHRGQEKTSRFTRYFISSSQMDVQTHMEFARSHWKIENSLHWVMDVTFGEDACRIRKGHEVQNLATLRRLASFLLKNCAPETARRGKPRASIRGRKKNAAWNHKYLVRALTN